MNSENTQLTTRTGDENAGGGGTQSPGPKAEIPSFDTIEGVKQYSDEA